MTSSVTGKSCCCDSTKSSRLRIEDGMRKNSFDAMDYPNTFTSLESRVEDIMVIGDNVIVL